MCAMIFIVFVTQWNKNSIKYWIKETYSIDFIFLHSSASEFEEGVVAAYTFKSVLDDIMHTWKFSFIHLFNIWLKLCFFFRQRHQPFSTVINNHHNTCTCLIVLSRHSLFLFIRGESRWRKKIVYKQTCHEGNPLLWMMCKKRNEKNIHAVPHDIQIFS